MAITLHSIYDPMCSWCWGFRPVWQAIQAGLPRGLVVNGIVGGLAPDSQEPMPLDLQTQIQANWQRIQQVIPGTEFNYDFWQQCQPRRSTYPACRAVLAAKQQGEEYAEAMVYAIQQAYYLEAQNPSDQPVLVGLAERIGLNPQTFTEQLNSDEIQQELMDNIALYHTLAENTGMSGFPSLILQTHTGYYPIPRDYTDAETTLAYINHTLEMAE